MGTKRSPEAAARVVAIFESNWLPGMVTHVRSVRRGQDELAHDEDKHMYIIFQMLL